jgi:hypothetical protein
MGVGREADIILEKMIKLRSPKLEAKDKHKGLKR